MESAEDEDHDDIYYELFSTRLYDYDAFYFEDIEVVRSGDELDCHTEVVFLYRYSDEFHYRSSLHVHSEVVADQACMKILFAIGMCVLPWCYLGYYTDKIVIKAVVASKCCLQEDMLPFWRHVYEQIIVEYCYINNLAFKSVELSFESSQYCHSSDVTDGIKSAVDDDDDADTVAHGQASGDGEMKSSQDSLSPPLIVPIGGGKDSLVVWHLVKQQLLHQRLDCNEHAHDINVEDINLLYVADGLQEYHHHRRLQRIIALTGASCRVVQHDFQNELIHRHRKSYLKPCAHPWAALVLFDSLLVHCMHAYLETDIISS